MCDETERRIQFLINKSKEMKISVTRPNDIETLERKIIVMANQRQCSIPLLFDTIERDIIAKEQFVV